jgi:hypothetical protein
MNEIQLLRDQLSAERRHVREVATACATARDASPARAGSALAALDEASTQYLGCVLDWFEQRDARLISLYARLPADDPARSVSEALGPEGGAAEALALLHAAQGRGAAWNALAQFIVGPWDTRRGAIEALLASNPRVGDWRAIAGIDADSVYRERAMYQRVRAALPTDVDLA